MATLRNQPGVPTAPTPNPANAPVVEPSTASAGDTWIRPAYATVMVYVPAGEFLMGSSDDDPDAYDEKPRHSVYLDAFWIDRAEVSNARYRQCVELGPCQAPRYWEEGNLKPPHQPVMEGSWHDAQAYTEWVGGRLPTEAE